MKDYDNKEIIIEKIILNQRINEMNIIVGNLMGSKSAVVIGFNQNKLIFSEEIGYIKSCYLKKVGNIDFMLLTLKYEDFCEYRESTIIYSFNNNKINQCFEVVTKEEYYYEDSICLGGNAFYVRRLDIERIDNYIKIILQKDNNELIEYIYNKSTDKFFLKD